MQAYIYFINTSTITTTYTYTYTILTHELYYHIYIYTIYYINPQWIQSAFKQPDTRSDLQRCLAPAQHAPDPGRESHVAAEDGAASGLWYKVPHQRMMVEG